MLLGSRWSAVTLKSGKDGLEGTVDFLSYFGTREDDFAADEDQEDDLGLDHSVDETREQFRLIGAEHVMLGSKTLKSDWELDVA